MLAFITWYLSLLGIGWLAFPLAYRLLPHLPGRGYALAKALGLLLWSFVFWMLASLQVIHNDGGGVLVSLLILAGSSALAMRGRWKELWAWLGQHRRMVWVSEGLFLAAFAAWAVVRAAAPEASGTEKPMELAFINAILHSNQFPPHDPWLSGYAISYYYFGYVMVALLSRLSGVSGEIGFNLGVASWFGLTAISAYGVLYDLLEAAPVRAGRKTRSAGLALLAPLFILLVSNANGVLEMLHADGAFWSADASGQEVSAFWQWLDIQELTRPPSQPYDLVPKREGGIWWWRSSRVLTDYDVNGASREIIDEFPAFSFVLGDLHPHVLAMPFSLLAVGLAFHLYLKTRQQPDKRSSASAWVRRTDFWLSALALGGLAFLNTWAFPIYVGLYSAAFLVARIQVYGWRWQRVAEALILGALTGVAGMLLYLPFYAGFASQAGGILPSLAFFTRGAHFWVMFAALLLPILFWLFYQLQPGSRWKTFGRGLGIAAILVFGLWLSSYLLAAALFALPNFAAILRDIQGGAEPTTVMFGSLANRLAQPGMWLSMLAILALVIGLLWQTLRCKSSAEPKEVYEASLPQGEQPAGLVSFLFLLALVGCLLVLVPEFFYLRDQFGWRMNTIFKFYFETWILWGLLAGYASAWLWREYRGRLWVPALAGWSLLLAGGLVYIYFGVMTRTQSFQPQEWTLDGGAYLQRYQPDDAAGIAWLRQATPGVVAEAVGGSYSEYARVATFSGQANVLGWPGHESQWRGGAVEIGSREQDLETLYNTADWETAKTILAQYHIRYVFVGSLENAKYKVDESKFTANLGLAYQNDSVRIYDASAILREEATSNEDLAAEIIR